MTPEHLINALLQGTLGGRKKRGRGALRYLTGGRGSLINAGTLLTAAGLAWGAYEAATRRKDDFTPAPGAAPPPPPGVPPLPPGALPPIPVQAAPGAAPAVPPDVLRLVRLTIAAARADGQLGETEREAILAQARAAGVEALVQAEMAVPRALQDIVAGVYDTRQKHELYTLAFAVVRADEGVSGGERIFLAQLAHALGLDPATTARLESETGEKIDVAAAAEG
ncbi:MAG TPA: DUF533 domain-containing protein [Vicinamibacteria bacterium]|nr:DUF533 domain-containing protein [Vicinamibacteria bacterium]